jgi:hypothetical protein
MKTKAITTTQPLPKGILTSDLQRPSYDAKDKLVTDYAANFYGSFELWHTTGFGWCIPTLLISSNSHRVARSGSERTYAARVSDGATVRIGMGPHVTERVTVYVRTSRLAALQPFLDAQNAGAGKAGTIRDRISSRRAEGVEMRAAGRSSWRWSV